VAEIFANRGQRRSSMLAGLIVAAGEEAAQKLVLAFGGARLYVPQMPAPEDSLSRVIGPEAAARLAQVYGGDRVDIPNPNVRRVRIAELRRAGLGVDAIARELGCTRRRVFQVLAEARAEARAALQRASAAATQASSQHPPTRAAGAGTQPQALGDDGDHRDAEARRIVTRRTAERFHP
jgi:hypothetical protein